MNTVSDTLSQGGKKRTILGDIHKEASERLVCVDPLRKKSLFEEESAEDYNGHQLPSFVISPYRRKRREKNGGRQ